MQDYSVLDVLSNKKVLCLEDEPYILKNMIGQAKLKIISKKIFLQIISVTEQIYIHKKQSKFIMYNTLLFKNKDIKYKLTKNIIIKFIKL